MDPMQAIDYIVFYRSSQHKKFEAIATSQTKRLHVSIKFNVFISKYDEKKNKTEI